MNKGLRPQLACRLAKLNDMVGRNDLMNKGLRPSLAVEVGAEPKP